VSLITTGLEELAIQDEFLDDHARDAKHGQADIIELLGLHFDLLFGVRGVQARRVAGGPSGIHQGRTMRLEGPEVAAYRIRSQKKSHDSDCKDNEGHNVSSGVCWNAM